MPRTIVRPPEGAAAESDLEKGGPFALAVYMLLGTLFGILLIKSEVASWFRIQEMFRFQSLHMYGVIGSACVTGFLSLRILRWSGAKTASGKPITIPPKEWGGGTRYWLGGLIFGAGWALTGACPGPQFALIGAGVTPMVMTLFAALAGAWVYGALRPRLPH